MISVHTQLLDSRPELVATSSLPLAEVFRLVEAESGSFERLVASADSPLVIEPAGGPSCLVFQPPGAELSYAEMVHPADFWRDELTGSVDGQPGLRVRHHLFAGRLEKGVILRARLRGMFVPRRHDLRVVAGCYAAFTKAELPLGT